MCKASSHFYIMVLDVWGFGVSQLVVEPIYLVRCESRYALLVARSECSHQKHVDFGIIIVNSLTYFDHFTYFP